MSEFVDLLNNLPQEIASYLTFAIVLFLLADKLGIIKKLSSGDENKSIEEYQHDKVKQNGLIAQLSNEVQELASAVRENTLIMKKDKEIIGITVENIHKRLDRLEV